ncbi:MAG: hypothetical protein KJ593_06875 [Candidatus Omnitrophica bacterium]|nr:hypothetical protein [Candidatus Omnitrophota bacterium]
MHKKSQSQKANLNIAQEQLLKIVKTWHIKPGRVYRIFKCGNCRRVLRRAWHHWLYIAQFKTPLHLCRNCQKNLKISYPKVKVNLKIRDLSPPAKLKSEFIRIISKWNVNSRACFKKFSCDYCKSPIYKANHINVRLNDKISEVHICRKCQKKSLFNLT